MAGSGTGVDTAGYLNGLSVLPRAVLSLRKLHSSATYAIRVRRSSDDAEMDVGFSGSTPGSALDSAGMLSWSGSDSVYVTKFYDQTGNGEDAAQTTAAAQPRIVNAGVYSGAAVCDNVDDYLKITSLTMATAYAGLYFKAKQPANHGDSLADLMFSTTANYTANNDSLAIFANQSADTYGVFMRTGTNSSETYALALGTMGQISALWDRSATGAAEIKVWKGGSELTPTSTALAEMSGTFATADMYIGARGDLSRFARLELETLVIYNLDTSGIRASIEALVA